MAAIWASLSGFLSALGQEAIKTWGSLAIVVTLLTWLLMSARPDNRTLRREVSRLQDLRVQDAQTMIRVAKANRATMAARLAMDAETLAAWREGIARPTPVTLLPQPESR